MLQPLDLLLRELLLPRVPSLRRAAAPATLPEQIGFQAPDAAWRAAVTNLHRNALNIYLVELRDNRRLRSNERQRTVIDGLSIEEPSPARVDCHYLISAWSPVDVTSNIEPTLDEHAMLYEVLVVLQQNYSLVPSRILAPVQLAPWDIYADVELPMTIAGVDGYPKLAEFWTGMGPGSRWRPAIHLVITLPVRLLRTITGPIVTTRIATWEIDGHPESSEIVMQIGGFVFDRRPPPGGGPIPDPPLPLEGAWVRLESITGTALQAMRTDEQGRFTFAKLRSDRYRLSTFAPGSSVPKVTPIDVPSASGSYEVVFT